MTKFYRSREVATADDDVRHQATTLGSQTAPGALLVPGEATHLTAVWVAAVTSNEAADGYSHLFRLEGPGIKQGIFTVPAHSGGGAVATGGHALTPSVRIPVNLPVNPGREITILGEPLGGDMGTGQMGITLEFGTEAGPEGEIMGEVTVEGEVTAVDTVTQFTSQGSTASPSRLTPPEATMLKRLVYSFGDDAAADGEVTVILRIGGDAVKGGEQTITLGGASFIDVQAGSDAAHGIMPPVVLDNLDIAVAGNETIDFSVEMAGVDVGTLSGVISAHFA